MNVKDLLDEMINENEEANDLAEGLDGCSFCLADSSHIETYEVTENNAVEQVSESDEDEGGFGIFTDVIFECTSCERTWLSDENGEDVEIVEFNEDLELVEDEDVVMLIDVDGEVSTCSESAEDLLEFARVRKRSKKRSTSKQKRRNRKAKQLRRKTKVKAAKLRKKVSSNKRKGVTFDKKGKPRIVKLDVRGRIKKKK